MLSLSHSDRVELVRRRFGSPEKLAAVIARDRTTVWRTISGVSKNETTQRAIAKACRVNPVRMFGVLGKAA